MVCMANNTCEKTAMSSEGNKTANVIPIMEKKESPEARKKEFVIALINFLESSITGTAESVNALAKIQENFGDEYEKFRAAKLDPSQLDAILKDLAASDKEAFLLIFARASFIAPKLNKLFDLTLEEKKELAASINNFSKSVKETLTNITNKKIGGKK